MNKSAVVFVGSTNSNTFIDVHSYAESSELYQLFAEVSRIVARKSNLNIHQAIGEYLNQCNKGEHVVLKSYGSFSKSIINRQCFLFSFSKIFETDTNIRNGLDYYQLVRLLCSDFPKEIIMNAVRIVEGGHIRMMEGLMNSQKFINALFFTFIYHQYLENFFKTVFDSKYEKEVSILLIFEWTKAEHEKNNRHLERPQIEILYQTLLNFISEKSNFRGKGITFVNSQTITEFIQNRFTQSNNLSLTYEELLKSILESKRYKKMVQKKMFCFQNSSNWANEAAKLLNVKQVQNPQPLNSKKMKKK